MTLAVNEEHRALADSVRRWTAQHAPIGMARATYDGEAPAAALWHGLAAQGFTGLHLAEEHGGAGYGALELAVTCEALGTALVPGPLVPSALASLLLQRAGDPRVAKDLLAGFADGSCRAAVALSAAALTATRQGDEVVLSGTTAPLLGGAEVEHVLLGARDGDDEVWVLADASALVLTDVPALDPTRRLAAAELDALAVPAERVLDGCDEALVRDLALVLLSAEAAGVAVWCLYTAVDYAKVREQFGRPIGQFQAVKHGCADMLVRVEMARAAAWDAAEAAAGGQRDQLALAAAVAGATAADAAVACGEDAIQILGGIGFTWEHDAHLYLRRAVALRQLLGTATTHRGDIARHALGGTRRSLELHLVGDDVERYRDEVRAFVASLPDDGDARRRAIADAGYQVPHWPEPWGRDAGPVEQLVIDEQLTAAGIEQPNLVIGGWILPTIIHHGSDEQRERFVRPTLYGDIDWCQMFSEPGAGSDLASLRARATRVEGGWVLNGQKVWTSLAREADWALCLARTDPEAPKHDGITAFIVDMASDGLDVRPLREISGAELFNEVFLNDVYVPDDLVCGPVDGGWKAARTTLANERVAMSSGSSMGSGVEGLLASVPAECHDDPLLLDRIGELVVEGQCLSLLGHRTTLARLSGLDPGAGSSVRKLVGGRHSQACAALTLELLGPVGATTESGAAEAAFSYLNAQCLTIAGGTTAVQRNVIAERLLGLPRDP